MEIFNTREIALGIWILVFLIFALSKSSIRKSATRLIKSVLAGTLPIIYISIILYTIVIVFLLFKIGLWDTSQLKNTILWLITVGFLSMSDVIDKNKSNYLKETVFKVFQFTTILEFLVGLYTFNLITELIIIPITIIIASMIAVGKTDAKLKPALLLLNNLLFIIGSALIVYTVYRIIVGFSAFATKGTLTEFLIPPVLSFLFLPFLYILSIVVNMEDIFVAIKNKVGNKVLIRHAKWQALIHFPFNKTDLKRWQQIILVSPIKNRSDIRRTIKILKQSKKVERNPPKISFADGWSPYQAKDFLISKGVITKFYQPLYGEEWQATSSKIDLENTSFSSGLIYSIRGSQTIAKELVLRLDVFFPEKTKAANSRFLDFAQLLYEISLKEQMPKNLQTAISKGMDITSGRKDKEILFKKRKWLNHKFNGYDLEFIVRNKVD